MKLRNAIAGAGVVTLAGTAVWALWTRDAAQPEAGQTASGPRAQVAVQPTAAVPASSPAARLLAGVYSVRFHMLLEAPGPNPLGGISQQKAELTATGKLDVAAPLVDGGLWLPVRFREVKVEANEAALHAAKLPLVGAERALQTQMFIAVAPDGSLGEARFAESAETAGRALLTGILQSAQFISAKDAAKSWDATESDINHTFVAHYEQTAPGAVTKSWSLTSDPAQADSLPPGTEGGGSARFVFNGDALRSLRHTQAAKIAMGGNAAPGPIRFETQLELDHVAAVTASWVGETRPSQLAAFVPASEAKVTKVASARGMAVILQDIAAAAAKGDWEQRHRLGSELAGIIRNDDRVAAEVGQRLHGPATEPEHRTMLEALAEAGTPAAQKEIVGVAADAALQVQLRTQALGAATFVKRPTDTMVRDLGTMAYEQKPAADAGEFSSNAALAVAAAVGHQLVAQGQETSPAAKQFVAEANARLGKAEDTKPTAPTTPAPTGSNTGSAGNGMPPGHIPVSGRARQNWIAAVGNAGLAETAPLLVSLLGDADEFSRAAAVFSMRFLPEPSVVPSLLAQWPKEDSIHVRVAILEACMYLGPKTTKTLVEKALRYDKSELVRETAAYTAASWMQRTPALKSILTDALQHEMSPKVHETIKNYLEPGRVAAPFRLLSGTPEAK